MSPIRWPSSASATWVLELARRMGLDLGLTQGVIEHASGQSRIGSDRMRRAIAGDLAPRAHMTLLEKDTRLAVQAAQQLGFEGPLGARARDAFAQASADGLAELDDAALLRWLGRAPSGGWHYGPPAAMAMPTVHTRPLART